MEDHKNIIYIVLALLYYGYKFLSKKKEEPEKEPRPKPQKTNHSAPAKKLSTVKELKKDKEAYEKPVHRPFYETQETLNYETVDYDTNPEKAKVENINPYQEYRTLKAENFTDQAPRFAEFATKPPEKHPILAKFKNKDNVKEAFIMSEIFHKKQF
jgi:Na+-transporting methylmalonyl-CoA/oxaloacetate decarboxylase gamma subunit